MSMVAIFKIIQKLSSWSEHTTVVRLSMDEQATKKRVASYADIVSSD